MLLRKIDQANSLCNGTQLQVNNLGKNIIIATIINRKNIGDKILIQGIDLVPSDSGLSFKFHSRQFSISICFATIINKNKG